jgi:uncharacterized membrane protein (DUF4010 family)
MDTAAVFQKFAVSCILGMLIGLEREYSKRGDESFAGVRTFSIVAVLGTLAALLAQTHPWVLPVAFVLVGALVGVGYWVSAHAEDQLGTTTEMASLIVFLLGAAIVSQPMGVVVAVGVGVAIILSAKDPLHKLVERIERQDIVATLKFAFVTFVILPVLPKAAYRPFDAPFDVFNPHKTWMMVILISGISFAGYVLVKLVGPRKGIGISGAIGGLVSSTAVTLTFSRKSKDNPALSPYFALAVVSASTIMFVRVLIEIAVVNPALVRYAVIPLAAMTIATLAYCAYLFLSPRSEESDMPQFSNPFELTSAVKFGALYALIVLLVKAAEHYVGASAIYLVSVLSGLTDVDAITLSVSEAARAGLENSVAVRAITIAVISNTCTKGALAFGLGSGLLRRHVGTAFGLAFAAGLVAMFFVK